MDFVVGGVKQRPLSCSFSNPRIPALSPSTFSPILPSSPSTHLRFQGKISLSLSLSLSYTDTHVGMIYVLLEIFVLGAYGNWNYDSTEKIIQAKGKSRCAASKIRCSAKSAGVTEENVHVKEKSVSVILLAGGKGKRMGASMPKQYLPLLGQPIALYSLYTFSQMIEVKEIVVVCDPSYRDIFEDTREKINVVLKFSEPGKERQDSVYSGLQAVDSTSELVCIHDSARPLVLSHDVQRVLKDGWLHGAAVLGVPVKATIKEANGDQFVVKTLDRKTLWEMQTPQVIRPALLKEGFKLVNRKGLEVTDDVSIVEHLKHPVYITEGAYTNIKITTPDDLLVAERILNPS